ncbi:nucleoside triphosphate pyrophosphatase [Senegalia massiliensis]|uniref:nucleoside triphosphate pyrophosphatase n=1 Tax=Senegalia massiliensis TaxID=1720316 RepID=UPI00102F6218|nr:Maf family protein [Senegalia massiliensis]
MKYVVLASSSSRRKEFLEKYNIKFKIQESNIQENIYDNVSPETTAISLAFQKAINVAENIEKDSIIIAADTIIYFDNKILGKPKDKQDAKKMLLNLSGKEHYVYTGIAIVKSGTNEKKVDYSKTKVKIRNLSEDMIDNYLLEQEYEDKAGSYAIQGKSEIFVESIEGSYTNVVGLPIVKLDKLLKEYFEISLI